MNDRAFWFYNDQWKHVYIVERYTQTDIFGADVKMARVKLTKHSSDCFETEVSKLHERRPKTRKERVYS